MKLTRRIRQLIFFAIICANFCAFICNAQELKFNGKVDIDHAFLYRVSTGLKERLKDSVVGWAYQIRKGGKIVKHGAGGNKIETIERIDGKAVPFDPNTRMHLASVSKTITAVAVAELVEMRKISFQDPIKKYLPTNWKIHPLFEKTTIADLLKMQSGIDGDLDAISSSYDSLKMLIAKGPQKDKIGKFNYQNTSYALFRIIIACATGLDKYAASDDSSFNSLMAAKGYIDFVNKFLFEPAHIKKAFCYETEKQPVLMYAFPNAVGHGLITGRGGLPEDGNLSDYAGGIGWYLSLNELSVFLDKVFYHRQIINQKMLHELMNLGYPFKIHNDSFGEYFGSGGDWMQPIAMKPRGGVHAYYFFFPDNIQIVVFTNSGSRGLNDLVVNSFKNALKHK